MTGGAGACASEPAAQISGVMSAADVIELIKKLPPEERAEVVAYARNEPATAPTREKKIRYVSDEKFAAVAPRVFEKHADLLRRLAQ